MLQLLRKVFSSGLIFVVDTSVKTLENVFHTLLGLLALRRMGGLGVVATVTSGFLEDLSHSSVTFLGAIPVRVLGLVEHVLGEVLDVLEVIHAHSGEVAGLF